MFIWYLHLNWGLILSGKPNQEANQLNQIPSIYKQEGKQRMALLESVSVLDISWIFLQRVCTEYLIYQQVSHTMLSWIDKHIL